MLTLAAGAVTVNGITLLVNFVVGSNTDRLSVPAPARFAAGMLAPSNVALFSVVASAEPFTSTTEVTVKPVPVIVIGTGFALIGVAFGDTDVIVIGAFVTWIVTCAVAEV